MPAGLPRVVVTPTQTVMSLKKGTRFGAMVVHSGTLFGGVHYSAVSQTFMSTSMEREYRVRCTAPLSQSARPQSPRIARG